MSGAKTYKIEIPDEPPIGTRVTSASGIAYENAKNAWFPYPEGGQGIAWEMLLRHGPLTDVTPLRTFEAPPEPPIGMKVRTFEAPPEPPIGMKVRDCNGDIWTHGKDGYWRTGEVTRLARRFPAVLHYAPLTEVR